jgi:hypothetical protein
MPASAGCMTGPRALSLRAVPGGGGGGGEGVPCYVLWQEALPELALLRRGEPWGCGGVALRAGCQLALPGPGAGGPGLVSAVHLDVRLLLRRGCSGQVALLLAPWQGGESAAAAAAAGCGGGGGGVGGGQRGQQGQQLGAASVVYEWGSGALLVLPRLPDPGCCADLSGLVDSPLSGQLLLERCVAGGTWRMAGGGGWTGPQAQARRRGACRARWGCGCCCTGRWVFCVRTGQVVFRGPRAAAPRQPDSSLRVVALGGDAELAACRVHQMGGAEVVEVL